MIEGGGIEGDVNIRRVREERRGVGIRIDGGTGRYGKG